MPGRLLGFSSAGEPHLVAADLSLVDRQVEAAITAVRHLARRLRAKVRSCFARIAPVAELFPMAVLEFDFERLWRTHAAQLLDHRVDAAQAALRCDALHIRRKERHEESE